MKFVRVSFISLLILMGIGGESSGISFVSLATTTEQQGNRLIGNGFAFETAYGPLPHGVYQCEGFLALPDYFEEGMIGTLRNGTERCAGIEQWRVMRTDDGHFFAVVNIPFPDPLVTTWDPGRHVVQAGMGGWRTKVECEDVTTTKAPIAAPHDVVKTENCARIFYGFIGQVETLFGVRGGSLPPLDGQQRVVSQFRRWVVKLHDDEHHWGYKVAVVEAFAPEHGNARWHAASEPRFWDGPPSLSEGNCPPADWRDICLKAGINGTDGCYFGGTPATPEKGWEMAIQQKLNGNPAWVEDGMHIADMSVGSHSESDYYMSHQTHYVESGGPLGCVAVVELDYKRDSRSDWTGETIKAKSASVVHALMERGVELHVSYTPLWWRHHVWYRRKEGFTGRIPAQPNLVGNESTWVEVNNGESEVVSPSDCPCREP